MDDEEQYHGGYIKESMDPIGLARIFKETVTQNSLEGRTTNDYRGGLVW